MPLYFCMPFCYRVSNTWAYSGLYESFVTVCFSLGVSPLWEQVSRVHWVAKCSLNSQDVSCSDPRYSVLATQNGEEQLALAFGSLSIQPLAHQNSLEWTEDTALIHPQNSSGHHKSLLVLKQLKIGQLYDTAIPLPVVYPKETKSAYKKGIYNPVFIAI